MDPIGGPNGITFDVNQNTLFIVTEYNDYYLVRDHYLSIQDKISHQINEWIYLSQINNIILTKDFTIIQGLSGHHLLYHSIDKEFYSEKSISS